MKRDAYVEMAERQLVIDEGLRLKPYKCPSGKLSIGIGRNLDDVGISIEEAQILFRNDLIAADNDLWLHIDCFRLLSDVRKAVLLNMRFQLGLAGLRSFRKMFLALKEGDYGKAADEMLDSGWAGQTPSRAGRLAEMMRKG